MDLKNMQYLRYLEAIYRHRNFTKAADELYISQPSITYAIQKLENDLGATLIDRSVTPLLFTDAGEHFMRHVHNILSAIDDAEQDMMRYLSGQKQTLRFVWASTMGDVIRPTLFTDFYERHPDYQILMLESTSESLLGMVRDGVIDFAYALIPDNYDTELYEIIPIQLCELKVIMSGSHPMAGRAAIALEELRNEKILMFPPGAYIRTKVEEKFKELHIVPHFHTVNPVDLIREMLINGLGVTLLPIDPVHSLAGNAELAVRPLKEPVIFIKGFILRRGQARTQPMKDLIGYVEDFVRSTAG